MKARGEEGIAIFFTRGKKKGEKTHTIEFQKSTHFSRSPISQETRRKSILTKSRYRHFSKLIKQTYLARDELT